MKSRKPEIAPAEFYEFIIDLLSCNDGVLPMTEVFDAIKRHTDGTSRPLISGS